MKKQIVLIFIVIFTSISLYSNYYKAQPQWNDTFDFETIEQHLRKQKIVNLKVIKKSYKKHGINAEPIVYLAILENGLQAIFKTKNATGLGVHAEVAAYKASKFLNINLVPPTVLRTYNNMLGSLQFYINTNIDLHKNETETRQIFARLTPKTISDMHIFDFVFGKTDVNLGNIMIQVSNNIPYLAIIDNASISRKQQIKYGDFAFVGERKPRIAQKLENYHSFENPKIIAIPTHENLKLVSPFLTPKKIRRYVKKGRPFCFFIKNNQIWIKSIKPTFGAAYTNKYFPKTIAALEKLNIQSLKEIWNTEIPIASDLQKNINAIIKQTLERKDQLLKAYYNSRKASR